MTMLERHFCGMRELGDVGIALVVVEALVGDVGVSLFVPGALFGVMLECHFSWQRQDFVTSHDKIS